MYVAAHLGTYESIASTEPVWFRNENQWKSQWILRRIIVVVKDSLDIHPSGEVLVRPWVGFHMSVSLNGGTPKTPQNDHC